jgi:hypothetical protein
MSNNSSTSGGVGFFSLLFLLFLGLKLGNVINWSWWWVTAPLWGGFAIILLVLAIVFIIAVINKISDF